MEEYWKMFVDAWRLFRKYAGRKCMQEADYQELAEDTVLLGKKHPEPFFYKLQMHVVDEIEKRSMRDG